MKLKSAALASALALSSIPALAVNTGFGLIGDEVEGFGNFFLAPAGLFSDSFSFSIASARTINGVTGWSGISNIGLVLLDSAGDTVAIDATPAQFSFSIGAGSYTLNVIGFGAAAGSFYGGAVNAVPEPETYALMLAGLGMVGFMAVRRRERS